MVILVLFTDLTNSYIDEYAEKHECRLEMFDWQKRQQANPGDYTAVIIQADATDERQQLVAEISIAYSLPVELVACGMTDGTECESFEDALVKLKQTAA